MAGYLVTFKVQTKAYCNGEEMTNAEHSREHEISCSPKYLQQEIEAQRAEVKA